MSEELVILQGARTAMAENLGAFKKVSAIELGAVAAKAAIERSEITPDMVDHTVMGNALQTSGDAIYGARHVALKAGVPIEKPALTINRLCGSGIQSIINAAHLLLLHEADYVLAGGMENMTQAPHVVWGARSGLKLANAEFQDLLLTALMDPMCGLFMAQTAEKIAGERGISREEQDDFALRSHRLGAKAVQEGVFAEEIVPVSVKYRGQKIDWDKDDHIKPDTSIEALQQLPPAFGKDGTVTAGNASGIVDGAAALIMTTKNKALDKKLKPIGKVVEWSVVGVDPSVMGIGPAPAIVELLKKADLDIKDIDLFEINEAFAAQYLAVEKELGLDRDRVNVNGGAIALGHPLAATGTRLIITVLGELHRRKARYGIASACIGGGQGIAILLERVE